MKTGDKIQVRIVGGRDWADAEVTLASKNGKSLALECNHILAGAEGVFINKMSGRVTVLLLEKNGVWVDLASGKVVELRSAPARR